MSRDTFMDAMEGGLGTYEWLIGHETEQPDKNTLNLERTAVTTGIDYVRQQGSPSPKIKQLEGWIVQPSQLNSMTAFYNACAGIGTPRRTILYKGLDDAPGTWHEVIITDWEPVRQLGRSGGTMLGYVWKYKITMEFIT